MVYEDPISPNYIGGGPAMYYDQLMALSELGHEIDLWHFATSAGRQRFTTFIQTEPKVWDAVRQRCKSFNFTERSERDSLLDRANARLRSLLAPQVPVPRWSLQREFARIAGQAQPDFIWAQHFEPATLAVQQKHVPVVYVHHDWLYRIKALRNNRAENPRQKQVEDRLVGAASAVVSGSKAECEEIKAAGARNVHYIPVSFEPVPIHFGNGHTGKARLVHLGGMGTTANRDGLQAFFERVWPRLKDLNMDFEIVGDTSAAPAALQEHLRSVKCTGFVPDLKGALRPLDIQIIPWEHSTGQRTRLPLAFNHGQVVVSTRAAVACYPEARDGENCRLVDTLEQMAEVIPQLAADESERLRLAQAARATFEKCFTRKALLPKYERVVESIRTERGAHGK